MRKIYFTLISVIMLFCLIGCGNKDSKKRYDEIKASVKKAVEWHISASYPKCTILDSYDKSVKTRGILNSSFLIKNGYIKKEELLDIDGKSYCDVYVRINVKLEDPLDQQKNCEVSYKIYLKCNNYEDNGYIKG